MIAVDRKDVIETAMRLHAVDVGGDDLVMVADADLIVLAAPVRQNIQILERLAELHGRTRARDGRGQHQGDIVEAARALPARLRFIGGHPLAGAAIGGISAARADLFADRPWILAADDAAQTTTSRRLEAFVEAIGAHAAGHGADAHDLARRVPQSLPQLTASALMHVVGEHAGAEGLALAGRGLRDTTRLGASPAGHLARHRGDEPRTHRARASTSSSPSFRPEAGLPEGADARHGVRIRRGVEARARSGASGLTRIIDRDGDCATHVSRDARCV